MADKSSLPSIKLVSDHNQLLIEKKQCRYSSKFLNTKTVDITSRLGQFAWRQITPSTIPLPVIFRHDNREEYLCVQMINIHLLSKFSSETISYYMKQSPLQYFSLTQIERKLFQFINQFHSNGCLADCHRLNYSQSSSPYITPFIPFLHSYQSIYSNLQFIQNNASWFFLKHNKPIIDKEKQDKKIKYSTNKMISLSSSPNVCKSNNSYCRLTLFHGKEIMSYSTASSTDSNEKILCLSINDIVSTYFPSTTPEQFIQLCRLKQIIRYKPDKSTHSDLSLRLINIQQLEQYWNFFIQQFSSNPRSTSSSHSQINQDTDGKFSINNSSSLAIDTNDHSSVSSSKQIEQSFENITENIPSATLSQHENSPCQMEFIQSIDNEQINIDIESLLNQLIEIIEEQENSSENNINNEQNNEEKTFLSIMENKNLKRKRRRSQKCLLTLKRRKRKQSNDQIQWWINKYSIQSISIPLQRVNLPID